MKLYLLCSAIESSSFSNNTNNIEVDGDYNDDGFRVVMHTGDTDGEEESDKNRNSSDKSFSTNADNLEEEEGELLPV